RECLARHHPDCWRGACAVCSSSNRLVAEPRPPVTSAAAATPPVARTDRADRTCFATVVVVAGLLGVVMAPSEVSPGLAFLLAPVTGIIAGRLTGQYRWPLLAPLAFSLTFVLLVAKHLSVEDTV